MDLRGYRIYKGETIVFRTRADIAFTFDGRFLVEYDDGELDNFFLPRVSTTGTQTSQRWPTNHVARKRGTIVSSAIRSRSPLRRGQCWYDILCGPRGIEGVDLQRVILGRGYIYDNMTVDLGVFDEAGPGFGNGAIQNRALADDIAPVDITHVLGITNTIRKINGFIWYYHCSGDVADRTLQVFVRNLGDGLPTGMTSGVNTSVVFYPSAAPLPISAGQEGMIYVNATSGKSFAVSLDQGVKTVEDITTDPDPFPYWAQESDVGELFFDVVDAEAADRHSIYIIEESWIY